MIWFGKQYNKGIRSERALTDRLTGMPLSVQQLFDDKRYTSVILITWMAFVWIIFTQVMVMDADFMHFGPGENVKIMGMVLDTWSKWTCIALFTFVSTSINAFVGDAIMPWIQNTIQDHKTRYIPYSKVTCIIITQTWTVYCCVMGVFALFVMLSQFDFMLVRISADLMVNIYTSYAFLRNKVVDRERYEAWLRNEHHETSATNQDSETQSNEKLDGTELGDKDTLLISVGAKESS